MNDARYLPAVIESLIWIAPDLENRLNPIRDSAVYAPPERQTEMWQRAADVLNTHAADHPKVSELQAIFSGVNNPTRARRNYGDRRNEP